MLFYNEPTRGTFTTTTEKIIIVYDHCEDMAPGYCATLLHRGYSNVYLLSGGLRLVADFVGFPLHVKKVIQFQVSHGGARVCVCVVATALRCCTAATATYTFFRAG